MRCILVLRLIFPPPGPLFNIIFPLSPKLLGVFQCYTACGNYEEIFGFQLDNGVFWCLKNMIYFPQKYLAQVSVSTKTRRSKINPSFPFTSLFPLSLWGEKYHSFFSAEQAFSFLLQPKPAKLVPFSPHPLPFPPSLSLSLSPFFFFSSFPPPTP